MDIMVNNEASVARAQAHGATCPICGDRINENLGEHVKDIHGEEEFKKAVLRAKEEGMPDPQIGSLYGVTFKQLGDIITEAYGINISTLKRPKRIKYWAPKDFQEETTTVWSFRRRGDWATHDGRYRGNWSPYIPRNVILKYSNPGDVVLDYFAGGGTTAVEAKLSGRRCIARDINPAAIGLTKENLNFSPPKTFLEDHPIYEPVVSVGDARALSDIPDESIDLICAHPPYAGIINYSSKVEGDLSKLSVEDFLEEIEQVARESYRVLKPGRKCAILIGDTRQKKHVVPIGFQTIDVFLRVGFKLKELVIKRQHQCKTTGFWYERSIKYNFLLLAHEHLPIFEKPLQDEDLSSPPRQDIGIAFRPVEPEMTTVEKSETTTVWLFPTDELEKRIDTNVIQRYSDGEAYRILTLSVDEQDNYHQPTTPTSLLFIKFPSSLDGDLVNLKSFVERRSPLINRGGFIVIQAQDVRTENGYIEPVGKSIADALTDIKSLWLKEVIIVTTDQEDEDKTNTNHKLDIIHQYLLVYEIIEGKGEEHDRTGRPAEIRRR